MSEVLSAQEALYRLLAATWDPHSLPAPASIPWPEVLRLVEASDLGGVVYAATKKSRGSMPADAEETLEQAFYRSAADNTRYLQQLAQVRAALSSVGAPLLLLKGAALAETLYPDSALRPTGDIDLLVRREDVPVCRRALLELGYVPGQAEVQPGGRLALSNQELFEPPNPYRAPVELHWHILDVSYYLRKLPIDWFWENSETRSIARQPFQVLNAEANLVYLPAHLALQHGFQGMHSLLDLALLIVHHAKRLDWQKAIAAACSFELVSALRGTLDRLAQCWPTLPIDEPRRLLHALTPSHMDARLFRLLSTIPGSPALQFYTTLVSLPDFLARARYIWMFLFPQPAYILWRYGIRERWQLPYWYLYHTAEGVAWLARILPQVRRVEREGR